MDNEKVIIALLIAVVLLSVATFGISLGLNSDKVSNKPVENPEGYFNLGQANVGFEIAETSVNSGGRT